MSVQSQVQVPLRDLVLERLAVAADEIFALFERTFAQYEEEVLGSKLMQQTQLLLFKDIQSVTVGVDIGSDQVFETEPIKIKQEVNPPINLQCPSVTVKCEEPEAAEEKQQDRPGEQCDEEEPGCSSQMILDNCEQPYSCSSTEEWECVATTTTKNKEQEQNTESHTSHMKDLANNNVNCDSSFSSNIVMSNEDEQRDVVHRCSQCYMTFTNLKALAVHLEIHPGPFTCPICCTHHHVLRTYKQHLRTHPVQKTFSCSVCKHSFSRKRHMDEHMRIHTGEIPFSCSVCGRKFRQRNSVERHILTMHSEYKPYRCLVCQRGFVQKLHFAAHMRGHTGERPFRCSACGQRFEKNVFLNRHVCSHKAQGDFLSELVE
ncbi:uncharacterized protein [Eucyclogobius newberryi]|uniref:uncharacterized protein isoform X1 n=1 Tax=Eucyclogobius newberryi TaxID=166745 RepID=UPI003B5C0E7E